MSKVPMSDKTPEIRAVIEGFFPGTAAKIASGLCPCCEFPVGTFRDEISAKEFEISGLCQTCQDEIFGVSDNG